MGVHENGNRIPLTKPVKVASIRPYASPWKPNQPPPNTNSHSQFCNDITTKFDVKTNWSFAISNKLSNNQKICLRVCYLQKTMLQTFFS